MGELKRQRRSKVGQMRRITVSVDPITHAAVKAVMENENANYSQAICALATSAALTNPVTSKAIGKVTREATIKRMERDGWSPGLSEMLARELITGKCETYDWN